jgi:hypothetical protein
LKVRASDIAPDLWDHIEASYGADHRDQAYSEQSYSEGTWLRAKDVSLWALRSQNYAHNLVVIHREPALQIGRLLLPTDVLVGAYHFSSATDTSPATRSYYGLQFDDDKKYVTVTGEYQEAREPTGSVERHVFDDYRTLPEMRTAGLQNTLIAVGVIKPEDIGVEPPKPR